MKTLLNTLMLLGLGLAGIQVAAAVKVVECEDEQGNRTFESTCPPGTTLIEEKKIPTGESTPVTAEAEEKAATTLSGTPVLYYIPECEPCDEVREFFQLRQIAITEKNVNDDIEVQNELKELRGSLKVPATVIGEKVITGYNRSELIEALESAGNSEQTETENPEGETTGEQGQAEATE